jgi:nitroreductase
MRHVNTEITDHLLTTTRSVRRRLDLTRPVPREVLLDCVRIAQQAPTAQDKQGWHFVIVDDPDRREALGEVYRRSYAQIRAANPASFEHEDPEKKRVYVSSDQLAETMDQVPALVVPCVEGRPEEMPPMWVNILYSSICPAIWSFILALRSRGLGSCWTSGHLLNESDAAELLSIPKDVTQVALLPVAYFTGSDFRPANRPPPETITHFNGW